MSLPTSEPGGKKELDSTLDPADFVQLSQFVHFPRTDTIWNIVSRLSSYSDAAEQTSNSFIKPVSWKVVIGGCGRKSLPPGIPRTAVLKVQSLMHTITKHNKDRKNVDRKSFLATTTREELMAMNQLTLNKCTSAPALIDYKVVLHQELPGQEIYVSLILMTECPGMALRQENFWMLPQVERDMVRQAFRRALSEIHACWVVLEQYESKHLIWNLKEYKVYFTQLAPSTSYGVTAHLPSRYLNQWHNDWFDLWDLTTQSFVDPFARVTDPKDVHTKDEDDGSNIAAWDFDYPAARSGMPICDNGVVERCIGKKAVEVGELVMKRRGGTFLGVMRRWSGV